MIDEIIARLEEHRSACYRIHNKNRELNAIDSSLRWLEKATTITECIELIQEVNKKYHG